LDILGDWLEARDFADEEWFYARGVDDDLDVWY
jgi:hypothetical protein